MEKNKKIITTPIRNTIKKFDGKFKTKQELLNHVNKEHETNLQYHQVYYEASKIYEEIYGKKINDAQILIQMAEEEQKKGLGEFRSS